MASGVVGRERITRLLRQWQAGERGALDELMAAVHGELRRLARAHMRGERPGRTLQPTALVNEMYLKLADLKAIDWHDRAHFFAMASRMMRRVLVDAARAREAGKRGGGAVRVTLDDARLVAGRAVASINTIALDEALTALAAVHERKARVVEMRFYSGMTVDEVAAVLDVSVETVARDWRAAKLWLRRELTRNASR